MQVGTDRADSSFVGPAPELAISTIESFGLDAGWNGQSRALSAFATDLGSAMNGVTWSR
jgi:hypothetical protein